jgi:hypothetical protein
MGTFSRLGSHSLFTARARFGSAVFDEQPRKKDDPGRNKAEQERRIEQIHGYLSVFAAVGK